MSKNGICIRCGRECKVEEHHIIPKIEGGGDNLGNKEDRCIPCHKFRHAELRILRDIVRFTNRLALLNYRLQVLREFNTPELIRERGTYKPYWDDETTHQGSIYAKL